MKYKDPEELNNSTPEWFKDWHDRTFWHFKNYTEDKLSQHEKILYGIAIVVIAGAITNIIFG